MATLCACYSDIEEKTLRFGGSSVAMMVSVYLFIYCALVKGLLLISRDLLVSSQ
jgi:hypothetical protein